MSDTHPRLRPLSTVRHAEVEGLRAILDLRTEAYYLLDEVGSSMWNALTGHVDPDAMVEALERRYAIEPERIRADLEAFARRCVDRGLLEESRHSPEPSSSKPGRSPRAGARRRRDGTASLTFKALRSLVATHLVLSRRGFRSTYESYARLPLPTEPSDAPAVATALAAFLRAEELFLSRRAPDDCLVRSLALHRFLRNAGLPAEHVIGVRRVPFLAHAWVECNGDVLLDDRPRRHGLTALARLDAGVG